MGNTYPNHEGNFYYRNHTLYHIGTLDPLGVMKEGNQILAIKEGLEISVVFQQVVIGAKLCVHIFP